MVKIFPDPHQAMVRILKMKAPVVSYTLKDEHTLVLDLNMDGQHSQHTFTLNQEHVMERKDGGKVKMKYTLEGQNILKQVIKMPDGKTAYFIREFGENNVKMTVKMDGTDLCATIHFEVAQ